MVLITGIIIIIMLPPVLYRGGIQSILGKPELERVMQRRRPDADGKAGSIRPVERSNNTRGSCMDNELETQLARRSKAIDTVSKPLRLS